MTSTKPPDVSELAIQEMAKAMETTSREARIQTHLYNMLSHLGLGPVTAQPVNGREADIFVTDRQCVFEVKATGGCNPTRRRRAPQSTIEEHPEEEQQEQLHWYVRNLAAELEARRGPTENSWYGVLTDGQNGWVYKYDQSALASENPTPPELLVNFCWPFMDDGPESVVQRLMDGPLRVQTGKPWAGDRIYQDVFRVHDERAKEVFDRLRTEQDTGLATKFGLWLEQMRATGLAPGDLEDQRRLFTKHTFLVAVAKCVIASLERVSAEPSAKNSWHGIGEGFQSWLTKHADGRRLIKEIWRAANRYDWKLRESDVLRNLYQDCVPKQDRKLYGEYYTPDWLAEMLTEMVLDEQWIDVAVRTAHTAMVSGNHDPLRGVGVLDPTCGSGTFLFHAARRLTRADYWDRINASDEHVANSIALLVNGIDIHPVAVEMARATVLRALPVTPTIELGIAQGDCLLVDRGQGGFDFGEIVRTSPGGAAIHIPREFIEHPQTPIVIPKLVAAAGAGKVMPNNLPQGLRTPGMQKLYQQLANVHRKEKNNVWSWWLRSMLHPYQLSLRKVDRILANPPWVRMSTIQVDERKREMIDLAEELGIWPKGKLATSFDICGIVMAIGERDYLTDDHPTVAAWVTNRAAISAGSWEPLREALHSRLRTTISFEGLKEAPFTGAPSAALLTKNRGPKTAKLLQNKPGSERISKHDSWQKIRPHVRLNAAPAFLSTPSESEYLDGEQRWRQGATIVPFCLLRLRRDKTKVDGDRIVSETFPSRHVPWVRLGTRKVKVDKEWVCETMNNQFLHPFARRQMDDQFIIPRKGIEILTESDAAKIQYWQQADHEYRKYRGLGRSTPETLLKQLNFNSKIEKMLPLVMNAKHTVFYNTSGSYVKATRATNTLADASVYYFVTDSEAEAKYLTALLNADCMQQAYAAARESDRDFHLHIWRKIPIPRYNSRDQRHRRLATLCAKAERIARSQLDPDIGTIKQDKWIRDELGKSGVMREINELVREILPQYSTR